MLGFDWSNLTVAGAFMLGAVLAAVATLRLTRAILELLGASPPRARRRLHSERKRREGPGGPEEA